MKPGIVCGLVAVMLGLTGCRAKPALNTEPKEWRAKAALVEVRAPKLSHEGDPGALRRAMAASLEYYQLLSSDRLISFGPEAYRAEELIVFLEDLIVRMDEWGAGERFFQYLQGKARFFKSAADSVLVTGYYEIRLKGSLSAAPDYPYPVYSTPTDLVQIPLQKFLTAEYKPALPDVLRARLTPEQKIIPYYSRHEIDRQGVLKGQNLELCWIKDPYRLFFLHIQGSGVVELEDGSELSLNYSDSNGHPYRSIGRILVDRFGVDIETLSMQGIYEFLVNHPQAAAEILDSNPSYVFFRTVPRGPIGSLGKVLTPMCSIATDYRLFPKGALAFLESEVPNFEEHGEIRSWTPRHMLVMNQDTGGAIRGPARVDWFIGSDSAAERTAGHLKQSGQLYFLAPKKNLVYE